VAVVVPELKLVNRRKQIDYSRARSQIDLDCEVSFRTDRERVVGAPRGQESGGRTTKDPATVVDKRNPFEGSSDKALSNELRTARNVTLAQMLSQAWRMGAQWSSNKAAVRHTEFWCFRTTTLPGPTNQR
jgi:hypothetical protein